jgi:hypothetical protein
MVLASNLTVSIEAEIVSTKTSQKLWSYTGTVVVDLTGSNGGNNGLAGLLVQVVATAVSTAAADYVHYAHIANQRIIYTLPFGPYHNLYMKDQSMQLISQGKK